MKAKKDISYGHTQGTNTNPKNNSPHEGPVGRDKQHHSVMRVVDMKEIHKAQKANLQAKSSPEPKGPVSKESSSSHGMSRADSKFSGDKYHGWERQHKAAKPGAISSLVGNRSKTSKY